MILTAWIESFLDGHPAYADLLKLDLQLGETLFPGLVPTDGRNARMVTLGFSLALAHAAKVGLPTDLSDWLEVVK